MRRWQLIACIGFLLLLFGTGNAAAQELPPAWADWIERWQEEYGDETGSDAGELAELYDYWRDNPVNLNDTNSDALRQLPFVDDLRWRILKAYIAQHGQLLSVDELYLLNGFDRQLVELLLPVVTVAPVSPPDTLSLRTLLTRGRSQLLVGSGGNIEKARGYRDDIYEGSPYRLYLRYQYHYRDRLQVSLSADKDAGEALFSGSQRQGFDFYSGHLLLRDMGIVRQAVVGHYNLQFGQGLTLWSGFAPYGSLADAGGRYARGICAASAFAEQGYLQGAATTLRLLDKLDLTLFYSNVACDATADTLGTLRSFYTSGYHRTANEIAKKDLLREQLYGLRLQYTATNLNLGATLCRTQLSDAIVPHDYLYNHNAFSGNRNLNAGLDGRYRYRRLTLYGEASMSQNGSFAGLAGLSLALTPDHIIGLSARHYDVDYQNLHAAPLARTSGGHNEEGLCLTYQTPLPLGFKARLEADAYRLPALRYGIYAPSMGSLVRVALTRQLSRQTQLTLQYSGRSRGRNATLDNVAEYVVEQTNKQQISADLQCDLGAWRLRTRAMQSWHTCELHDQQKGFLLYQDLQYTAPRLPLTLAMRFLLFDVNSYDARLYAAESDVAYQFSTPAYSGQGYRFYFVARYALSPNLHLSAKYALTTYPNAETIGSSYEQIAGDHRQQWKLQLRWQF